MLPIGVLLINLGTPDHPDIPSIRSYLKEFLSDPRVIDLPAPARWLLLHAIILPFRPRKTTAAYQKIWSPTQTSPLLAHSQALSEALSEQLGGDYQVALGMRYGNPSIASALDKLQHCQRLIILPLFPQYSSAATGSALEKSLSLLAKRWNVPEVITVRDFYANPDFIQAYATLIQQTLAQQKIDRLIFSYHGLPERHITKSQCTSPCTHLESCPAITAQNAYCYRAQCYATSAALAKAMNLGQDEYTVCFQSRLGKTPWIKPYTDEIFATLIQKGIRHIAIACPSFIADCLETLEEIGIRGKEQWQSLGGETFILIPCLNAEPAWVKALTSIIHKVPLFSTQVSS